MPPVINAALLQQAFEKMDVVRACLPLANAPSCPVSAEDRTTAKTNPASRRHQDGNGSLDRSEIKQLMQIMEPRRGITNEELDAAMKEIDTSVRVCL